MRFELDPDFWLYTRLTLGRGWRLAAALALWAAGLTLIATVRLFRPVLPDARGGQADDPYFLLALFVLINAPVRPLARLLDTDRDGLLDQTRLCGRPPHRVLFAFLFGSIWPLLLVAIFMLVNHLRFGGDVRSVYLALMAFVAALAVSLLAYGTLPPGMTPDSRFLAPLLFVFSIVAFSAVAVYAPVEVSWVRDLAFGEPMALTTMAIVATSLVLGVRLASSRLARPPQALSRGDARSVLDRLSRLVPRWGPPDFNKQLRRGLLSGGTLLTIVAAPLAILLGERMARIDLRPDLYAFVLNAVPYVILLIGAFATSMTVRSEIESSTIDFVRLTPQRPEAIALSWYAAFALPFWIAILFAAVVLRVVAPDMFSLGWPLAVLAAVLPATSMVEGLQGRRPAAYLWLPMSVAGVIGLAALVQRETQFRSAVTIAGIPWSLDLRVLVPALGTIAAIGAAAGRLRRPDGPALAGAAAAGGVATVVVLALVAPPHLVPRLLPGLLVMCASFAGEERDPPTAPWRRIGIAGAAAFVGGVTLAQDAAVGSSLAAGVCAALAVMVGVLVHELFWRVPPVSVGLRLAVMLWLLQAPRLFLAISSGRWPGEVHIPRLLEVGDIMALAAAFVTAAVAHTIIRGRANTANRGGTP